MSTLDTHYHGSVIGTFFHDLRDTFKGFFRSVNAYFALARAENELRGLDARMLQDIGLSRGEISFAVRHGDNR